MATVARPRWADLVDSSQEEVDEVAPLRSFLRHDSFQDTWMEDSHFLRLSRKLALASWSCSCFSKLSDGVDAPQKPQIID